MNAPSLQDLMRSATQLTQSGKLREATQNIQQMLKQASEGAGPYGAGGLDALKGLPQAFAVPDFVAMRTDPSFAAAAATAADVIDGCVFEAGKSPVADTDTAAPSAKSAPAATREGGFFSGRHSDAGRTLDYKLYVPPGAASKSLPMVVMLHGCTQNPDDFAAGTGMNALAREQGFVVLYPAQSQQANPSRCWNWFKHSHQRRGSGEPAVIASLTRKLITEHSVDARRVYVAGLSAGGAMAAIIAGLYPELFAAAGVHSGLPAGAARDMPGAFAAMKSGATLATSVTGKVAAVPTIVFHGDRDETVHPLNGEKVIAAALGTAPAAVGVEEGVSPQGRRYTRSLYGEPGSRTSAEHWVLHGAGHAWSGGSAAGSYTDGTGPDASREMMRFFSAHPAR